MQMVSFRVKLMTRFAAVTVILACIFGVVARVVFVDIVDDPDASSATIGAVVWSMAILFGALDAWYLIRRNRQQKPVVRLETEVEPKD